MSTSGSALRHPGNASCDHVSSLCLSTASLRTRKPSIGGSPLLRYGDHSSFCNMSRASSKSISPCPCRLLTIKAKASGNFSLIVSNTRFPYDQFGNFTQNSPSPVGSLNVKNCFTNSGLLPLTIRSRHVWLVVHAGHAVCKMCSSARRTWESPASTASWKSFCTNRSGVPRRCFAIRCGEPTGSSKAWHVACNGSSTKHTFLASCTSATPSSLNTMTLQRFGMQSAPKNRTRTMLCVLMAYPIKLFTSRMVAYPARTRWSFTARKTMSHEMSESMRKCVDQSGLALASASSLASSAKSL